MTTRVGIVGTGSLGRVHARILTEMPEATVVGFVDPRDEAAAEVTSTLNIRPFDSVAALKGEIDAAVVATPTTSHLAVAGELLEAG
ncbi:MAG TPA: Gfo/Idh/MocA family oxidoreductase, partial [Thermoanaerobaculia bacterium]